LTNGKENKLLTKGQGTALGKEIGIKPTEGLNRGGRFQNGKRGRGTVFWKRGKERRKKGFCLMGGWIQGGGRQLKKVPGRKIVKKNGKTSIKLRKTRKGKRKGKWRELILKIRAVGASTLQKKRKWGGSLPSRKGRGIRRNQQNLQGG